MDWNEIVNAVNGPGGVLVVLILVLLAGKRGWWVFGRELDHLDAKYEAMLAKQEALILVERGDKDEWKRMALGLLGTAKTAVNVAERTNP